MLRTSNVSVHLRYCVCSRSTTTFPFRLVARGGSIFFDLLVISPYMWRFSVFCEFGFIKPVVGRAVYGWAFCARILTTPRIWISCRHSFGWMVLLATASRVECFKIEFVIKTRIFIVESYPGVLSNWTTHSRSAINYELDYKCAATMPTFWVRLWACAWRNICRSHRETQTHRQTQRTPSHRTARHRSRLLRNEPHRTTTDKQREWKQAESVYWCWCISPFTLMMQSQSPFQWSYSINRH